MSGRNTDSKNVDGHGACLLIGREVGRPALAEKYKKVIIHCGLLGVLDLFPDICGFLSGAGFGRRATNLP